MNKHFIKDNWPAEATSLINRSADGSEIILFMTNYGQADMCINAVLTLLETGLSNYVIMAIDQQAYDRIKTYDLNVFLLEFDIPEIHEVSGYGQTVFGHTMYQKFPFILQVISLGYNVLWSDGDVLFYQNPYPYFSDASFQPQYGDPQRIDWDRVIAPAFNIPLSKKDLLEKYPGKMEGDFEILELRSRGIDPKDLYDLETSKLTHFCAGFMYFKNHDFCKNLLTLSIESQWLVHDTAKDAREWQNGSHDENHMNNVLRSGAIDREVWQSHYQALNLFRFPHRFLFHGRYLTPEYQDNAIMHCNMLGTMKEKLVDIKDRYKMWKLDENLLLR